MKAIKKWPERCTKMLAWKHVSSGVSNDGVSHKATMKGAMEPSCPFEVSLAFLPQVVITEFQNLHKALRDETAELSKKHMQDKLRVIEKEAPQDAHLAWQCGLSGTPRLGFMKE